MKTVICFGTFDLLHLGHLSYFKQAKKYGDYLVVVVARDHTKEKQKKKILFTEDERLKLLQSLRLVDEAVLGDKNDHFKIIVEKKADVIVLGYDHSISEQDLKKELAKRNLFPQIFRAKPFKLNSHQSTILRSRLQQGGT